MKFSISILAHNNLALTKRCVESVLANSEDYDLIITDNGSTDGTKEFLLGVPHNGARVYLNKDNEGFIQPNIEALFYSESDYFVMLNSDTQVPPGWLDALEKPFLDDPRCAITGATGMGLSAGMVGYNAGKNVEYIEGSCLMIRTDFAKAIGLFDENLVGAYLEDVDLSLRVRQMGLTIHVVPIDIKHLGGATSSLVPQAHGWLKQNAEYCRKKWSHYLKTRTFQNAPPHSPH